MKSCRILRTEGDKRWENKKPSQAGRGPSDWTAIFLHFLCNMFLLLMFELKKSLFVWFAQPFPWNLPQKESVDCPKSAWYLLSGGSHPSSPSRGTQMCDLSYDLSHVPCYSAWIPSSSDTGSVYWYQNIFYWGLLRSCSFPDFKCHLSCNRQKQHFFRLIFDLSSAPGFILGRELSRLSIRLGSTATAQEFTDVCLCVCMYLQKYNSECVAC